MPMFIVATRNQTIGPPCPCVLGHLTPNIYLARVVPWNGVMARWSSLQVQVYLPLITAPAPAPSFAVITQPAQFRCHGLPQQQPESSYIIWLVAVDSVCSHTVIK